MTLQQLSPQYAAAAAAIHQRIRWLTEQMKSETDPEELMHLRRRISDLRPLERQSKELAKLTAHYYDRRYHSHG